MNCFEFEQLLKKSINEKLSKEETKQIFIHKQHCKKCEENFQKIEKLKKAINNYKQNKSDLSANFHKNLIDVLKKEKQKQTLKMVLVASILFFVSGILFFNLKQTTNLKKTINVVKLVKQKHKKTIQKRLIQKKLLTQSFVKKGKPITIKLDYFTNQEIKQIKITIKLDKRISFYSFSKQVSKKKTIEWQGSLHKGKNSFPFIVQLRDKGIFKIETIAKYGAFIHKHKIILNSTQKNIKITYYETIIPIKKNG